MILKVYQDLLLYTQYFSADKTEESVIREAIHHWEDNTCLRFIKAGDVDNGPYIQFVRADVWVLSLLCLYKLINMLHVHQFQWDMKKSRGVHWICRLCDFFANGRSLSIDRRRFVNLVQGLWYIDDTTCSMYCLTVSWCDELSEMMPTLFCLFRRFFHLSWLEQSVRSIFREGMFFKLSCYNTRIQWSFF